MVTGEYIRQAVDAQGLVNVWFMRIVAEAIDFEEHTGSAGSLLWIDC